VQFQGGKEMARTASPFASEVEKLRREIKEHQKVVSGAARDITAQRRAVAQLQVRRQYLQDLIQAKERMIARYAELGSVRPPARRRGRPGRPPKAARPPRRARKRRVSRTPTPATVEVTSDRFAALSVVDAAEHVLKNAGKPVHLSEIITQIMAGGKAIRAKQPHISIRYMIARDKRFRKTGKNVWALA